MIGFSEVCQFEIDRERFRHLMRFGDIQTANYSLCTFDQAALLLHVVSWSGVQLSMLDQQETQLFNRCKEVVTNLFFEDFAEQTAERTHIATQWSFLQFAIMTGELFKPCSLLIDIPESRHNVLTLPSDMGSIVVCHFKVIELNDNNVLLG
jgi:hypothetical protein